MKIHIEEKWWSDIRRSALIRALKNEELADGVAVRMWKYAVWYAHYKDTISIPLSMFRSLPYWQEFIDVGLAEIIDTENVVYVKGSRGLYFSDEGEVNG